jgi:group I intron endonuclease
LTKTKKYGIIRAEVTLKLSEVEPIRCGIYKLTNTVTGMIYIGQAQDIAKRWRQHIAMFQSGHHHNKSMLLDFKSHGLSSFEAVVVEECGNNVLNERERYWTAQEKKELLYSTACLDRNLAGKHKKSKPKENGIIKRRKCLKRW